MGLAQLYPAGTWAARHLTFSARHEDPEIKQLWTPSSGPPRHKEDKLLESTEHTEEKHPTRRKVSVRAPPSWPRVRMLEMCGDTISNLVTPASFLAFHGSWTGYIDGQWLPHTLPTHDGFHELVPGVHCQTHALLHNTDAVKTPETGYKTQPGGKHTASGTRQTAQGKQGRRSRSGLAIPADGQGAGPGPGFPSVGHGHLAGRLHFLS